MSRRSNPQSDTLAVIAVLGLVVAGGYVGYEWWKNKQTPPVAGNTIPGNPDWGSYSGVPGNYGPVGTPGQPNSYRN